MSGKNRGKRLHQCNVMKPINKKSTLKRRKQYLLSKIQFAKDKYFTWKCRNNDHLHVEFSVHSGTL